jgi:IS30 family transposase
MVSVHVRPPQIDERVSPGDWQCDTTKGSGNASAVGTLVECATLFVTLVKLADGTANSAVTGFSRALNRIDAQNRISMTYDHGKEMAAHATLSDRARLPLYPRDASGYARPGYVRMLNSTAADCRKNSEIT